MKYVIFGTMAVVGVPLMISLASSKTEVRGWLFSLLIAAAAFGKMTSINFLSHESYRGPDRGFEVTLADLICWSLIVVLVTRHRASIRWLPFNSIVLALFFLVSVFSVVTSATPLWGAFTLFKMVRLFLIYWCVSNMILAGASLDRIWYGLMISGTILTTLALKQKYLDGFYRIQGPFDHSNSVPLFLNLILPSLLIWGLADRRLRPWQVVATMVVALGMAFSVVATFSRAGTALMGLGMIAALMIANTRGRSLRAMAVSGIVFILMLGGMAKASDSLINRVKNAPKASEQARDEFNIAADAMLKDHPAGVGLNNFSSVLTNDVTYRAGITVMKNEVQAGVCHHIYKLTAAELGYAGLGLFLLILARFEWRMLRYAWQGGRLEGLLLAGWAIGGLALHLGGMLEWAFRVTPVVQQYMVVAGLGAGLSELARQGRRAPRLI